MRAEGLTENLLLLRLGALGDVGGLALTDSIKQDGPWIQKAGWCSLQEGENPEGGGNEDWARGLEQMLGAEGEVTGSCQA